MKYNVLMRKARLLLILGTWVAILPYLGFPYTWKEVFFTLSGLGIIYMSYSLYKDYKKSENKSFDNFSENNYFREQENSSTEETGTGDTI
jgi:hypothetical protein